MLELERYVYNKFILEATACVLALSRVLDFSSLLPAWLLNLAEILLLISPYLGASTAGPFLGAGPSELLACPYPSDTNVTSGWSLGQVSAGSSYPKH